MHTVITALTLACFVVLIASVFFGDTHWERFFLRSRFRIWTVPALLYGLYLFYTFGTDSTNLSQAVRVFLYLSVPTLLLCRDREPGTRLRWRDAGVILAIWLPFDFRWL